MTRRTLGDFLLSSAARPLRFAGTGLTAAAVQLCLLGLLEHHAWNDLLANVVALAVATQVNFVLSLRLTWSDRRGSSHWRHRWLKYHSSVGLMALLNFLVFVFTRSFVPSLVASALGIGAGSIGNYFMADCFVFRRQVSQSKFGSQNESVA